ncbi:MAG: pitrilysin family protein [Gemmatimonadales bacterium]
MSRLMLAALSVSVSLAAQQPVPYEYFPLDNGLRVFLIEDHDTPVVTVNVWYNVGSRNERPGRSGFAHLFEHMMFQGSANADKGAHMQLIERAGGNMNGSTNTDRTNYYQTLPSNRLNLGLWLEADRMRSLAITPENFENQRETVKEERRLRIDNQPYARAFVDGLAMQYDSVTCYPYSHTVIGSMDDLNATTTPDVQAFFDLYYAPNNATLVVVGDFQPAEARRLIQQYFGDIPQGAEPPPVDCRQQLNQGAQRIVWPDAMANLPAVLSGFLIPGHDNADTPALSLLSTILGGGESSRLNQALVRDQQLAVQAGVFTDSRRGPGQFVVLAVANQGVTTDTLEAALMAEVARIGEEGVTEEELERAKNAFRSTDVFGRQTSMNIAERIQHYAHDHADPSEINTDADRYLSVTLDDIHRVAQRYLVPNNSLLLIVTPARQAEVQP